jgi:hypothetical protein
MSRRAAVRPERPASPKAVIQVARICGLSMSAFGHSRPAAQREADQPRPLAFFGGDPVTDRFFKHCDGQRTIANNYVVEPSYVERGTKFGFRSCS